MISQRSMFHHFGLTLGTFSPRTNRATKQTLLVWLKTAAFGWRWLKLLKMAEFWLRIDSSHFGLRRADTQTLTR